MAPRAPRSRSTRTKTDLSNELDEVTTTTRSRETTTAKDREQKAAHDSEVRKAVEGVTAEKVVNKVTQVSLDVNRTFQAVTEQLVQASQELDTIRSAIALEKEELERLHGVDVVAASIDTLVADYEARKTALEEQAARDRGAWGEEQVAHLKAVRERDSEIQKNRTRDEADHVYSRDLRRKQEQNDWSEELRQAQVTERDRKEALEKEWVARASAIAAQENDIIKLRTEAEAFPAKLDAEVKKHEAIVGNSIKRDYEHKIALLQKDYDAGKSIVDAQNRNLTEHNARLTAQVTDLTEKLSQSNEKVQSIAKEALTSAGNSRALAEITAFAERASSNNGNRSKA